MLSCKSRRRPDVSLACVVQGLGRNLPLRVQIRCAIHRLFHGLDEYWYLSASGVAYVSECILHREDAKRTHLQPGLFKTLTSCFTVCSKTCAGVISICVILTISWWRGGRIGSCLPLSHRSVRCEMIISFGSCEDVSDQQLTIIGTWSANDTPKCSCSGVSPSEWIFHSAQQVR